MKALSSVTIKAIREKRGIFMRKTKIICTIGPASTNEETLAKMFEAGMNVARINFSHGDHAEQQEKIDLIKRSPSDSIES